MPLSPAEPLRRGGRMGRFSWAQGDGPLVPFADGFERELLRQGRSSDAARRRLMLMGQLNRWLSSEDLGVSELTVPVAQQFLDSRRAHGWRRLPTLTTLAALFDYLREQDVLRPEPPNMPTRLDELLARYRQHLLRDRALTPTTTRRYEGFARRFLADRASRTATETGAEGLSGATVSAYLLEASSRLVVESAKREAADLRALLRFLYSDGLLDTDLGSAMPPVA